MRECSHSSCSKCVMGEELAFSRILVALHRRTHCHLSQLRIPCILDWTTVVNHYKLKAIPREAPAVRSATAFTVRSELRISILCKAAIDTMHRVVFLAERSSSQSVSQPRCLSTHLAANVEPDPGTLLDLGEQVTPTRAPCPNARIGLCGCLVLGRFPLNQMPPTDFTWRRWLTFRATLVPTISGGPDLDFPQHDADTLASLADLAADFNILGFPLIRHSAASPDADAIVCSGGPDPRVRVTYILRSGNWSSRALMRVTSYL